MKTNWFFRENRIYKILLVLSLVIIPATLVAWLGTHFINTESAILILTISLAVLLIVSVVIRSYEIYQKQESEIELYRMYTKPLEELIREIRARQHEFNNHLNAILNMHLTVDNYDELVRCQSDYIFSIADDKKTGYLSLLKLSDKILAGFLYTKLVSVNRDVEFEIEVDVNQIVTNAAEKDIIEVLGILIDNAVDASNEDNRHIRIRISSIGAMTKDTKDDKLIFEIQNEHPVIPINELGHFFERGYSTKSMKGNRGYGLYNARRIIKEYHGQITVENLIIDDRNYIDFKIEM